MLTVWLLHLEACLWLHCLYTSESRSKGMVCYFVAMTEVTFQSSIKNENPVTKPLEELVSLSYSLLQKDDKYCTKEFWGINLTWKRSRFKHSSCLIQMKIWSKILVFISSALTLGPSLCHGPKHFFPQQSSEPDKLGLADAKASSKNGAGWYQQMPPMMPMRLIEAQWFGPPQHLPAISSALSISQTCLFLPLWRGELNVGQHLCSVWQGHGISKFSHRITKLEFNGLGTLLTPKSAKPRMWSFSAQTAAVELFIFG